MDLYETRDECARGSVGSEQSEKICFSLLQNSDGSDKKGSSLILVHTLLKCGGRIGIPFRSRLTHCTRC